MLSSYGEAEGDYDEPLRRLLRQPHAEAAPTFGHLHARLLWCQVDADDLASFRDRVLVPLLTEALAAAEARRAADRRSGRPGRAGARAGGDRRPEGAGRVEEDGGGAAARRGDRAQKVLATRARGVGARARQPAADDQEGELLQRRRGRVPDRGHRAAMTRRRARRRRGRVLDMNRYQWTVLFAAWLGWGFDVFDGLLFNYVAPNCVPTLLGLPIGSAAAKAATLQVERHPDVDPAARLGARAASCSARSRIASAARAR